VGAGAGAMDEPVEEADEVEEPEDVEELDESEDVDEVDEPTESDEEAEEAEASVAVEDCDDWEQEDCDSDWDGSMPTNPGRMSDEVVDSAWDAEETGGARASLTVTDDVVAVGGRWTVSPALGEAETSLTVSCGSSSLSMTIASIAARAMEEAAGRARVGPGPV
jgi:hypothetical protein